VRLGSLTPVRDFTYVKDTARAFMAVASHEEALGQTLNAGNGKGITIGELADMIIDIMGSDAKVVADEARVRPDASEVFELLADASKLNTLTGWAPQTGLREGLEHTVAFVRERLAFLKPHLYTV
jgi:nucleoside-diphosphate-sugar epimerase